MHAALLSLSVNRYEYFCKELQLRLFCKKEFLGGDDYLMMRY